MFVKGRYDTFISLIFSLVGLCLFLIGLLVPYVPVWYIYVGYLVLIGGLIGLLFCLGYHKLKACWIFILCWIAGVLLSTFFFIPLTIIAMGYTAVVHIPLAFLTCYAAKHKKRVVVFYVIGFLLALVLPHFMIFTFEKPYPIDTEKIEVSADMLKDKNPPFIDEEQFWHEDTVELGRFLEVKYRINKTSAVVGLDICELEDQEKEITEQLFSTYEQALIYAKQKELPIVPSVQMVDHKAKTFVDRFYATIEEYLHSEAEILGGGMQKFFIGVLEELIKSGDNSEANLKTIAYMTAGLELGGEPLPELPKEALSMAKKLEEEFLSSPIQSKPIGFYAENEILQRIFRQDRFYQNAMEIGTAIEIAKVLKNRPDLHKQYKIILSAYSDLTNPLSSFSVDDIVVYADYFDEPAVLERKLLESEKWLGLKQRGAGRIPGQELVRLLPYSTSKENELFAKIYNYSGELPRHNVMNRLIKAIRSGEIDLTPTEKSGWYDYQIYAVETLLATEKGQEGQKLLLSKLYKERLIEAFKTILTKKRELHVKQLELTLCLGLSRRGSCFVISPDISVEPMATYYLRTARGYRFILNAMEALFGREALEETAIDGNGTLYDSAEEMSLVYYGFYLIVCDDLGMKPEFMPDEMSEEQVTLAKQQAVRWLENYQDDNCYEKDVRYIVSALSDLRRTQVRYWMTCGVKLLKVKAEYVKRPVIQVTDPETNKVYEIPTDTESGEVPGCYLPYRFMPEEYYMPIEIFAEATGPAKPFTREEFRKLCNGCKNKDEIIKAVRSKVTTEVTKPFIFGVIIAGVVLSFLLLRGRPFEKLHSSRKPDK